MRFWTTDDGLDIHAGILAVEEGVPGILSMGALHSAIERARWDPFPFDGDIFTRAALLLRGIVQDHPFVDGNKRTAFEATDAFLRINSLAVDASPDEVTEFMVAAAMAEHDTGSIRAWLWSHTKAIPGGVE